MTSCFHEKKSFFQSNHFDHFPMPWVVLLYYSSNICAGYTASDECAALGRTDSTKGEVCGLKYFAVREKKGDSYYGGGCIIISDGGCVDGHAEGFGDVGDGDGGGGDLDGDGSRGGGFEDRGRGEGVDCDDGLSCAIFGGFVSGCLGC
jgi:hypothetical protein